MKINKILSYQNQPNFEWFSQQEEKFLQMMGLCFGDMKSGLPISQFSFTSLTTLDA